MDIVSNYLLNLYLCALRSVQLLGSFFVWGQWLKQKLTTNQNTENKCHWTAQPPRGRLYLSPLPQLLRDHHESGGRKWKVCKSQRLGRMGMKQCLLDVTGPCAHELRQLRLSVQDQASHYSSMEGRGSQVFICISYLSVFQSPKFGT